MAVRQRVEQFVGKRVLVLGDVMLDEYLYGDTRRISADAPVPVVQLERRELRLGGAASVARNLKALGASPLLLGVVGRDNEGAQLRGVLAEQGIAHHLLMLPDRRTTHKIRVVARGQQLLRLDDETPVTLDAAASRELFTRVCAQQMPAAVILSDDGKGTLSPLLLQWVMRWASESSVPVFVDPKAMDVGVYRGATYLTPDVSEAALAARMRLGTEEGATIACRRLLGDSGARGVLLTRGAEGLALVTRDEAHFLPGHGREGVDVTGAEETVLAAFTLGICAGADPLEAMALAHLAARVVVEKAGAASCTGEELCLAAEPAVPRGAPGSQRGEGSRKLLTRAEAAQLAAQCGSQGRRVVFTSGCFDGLHAGHVAWLEAARARGDVLLVGLRSDASIQRLEGPRRPLQRWEDRARLLAAFQAVDGVVPFDEDTPLETVLAVRPQVLVEGGDDRFSAGVGAREVSGWGGEVAGGPLLERRSAAEPVRLAAPDLPASAYPGPYLLPRPSA